MSKPAITRLRRLVRLTRQVHQSHARDAAEVKQAQLDLAATAVIALGYLDGEGPMALRFPDLIARHAANLGRHLADQKILSEKSIVAAVASRAIVDGLETKLVSETATQAKKRHAQNLEEAVERFVDRLRASLP